jgi:hypothetical protein
MVAPPPGEAREEPLGVRSFWGVGAEGVRSVRAIPAGAIGNERPIEIVSERWYSEELHEVVLRRHEDPRFGTTTYRLDELRLGDPDPALFEIPADYEVIDTGGAPEKVLIRRRD